MIDFDKLDSLMELPISEEMIGAYLEGNLIGSELRDMENLINDDFLISNLIDDVEVDNSLELSFASEFAQRNILEFGVNDIDPSFELPAIEFHCSENYVPETIVTELISDIGEDLDSDLCDLTTLSPLSYSSESISGLE